MKLWNIIQKINDLIALRITLIVSTMWCFYMFCVLCFLPLVAPAAQNQILYVSNCFQLALLPLIMVGQDLIGKKAEIRSQEDHDTLMNEMAEIKRIHSTIDAIAARLVIEKIVEQVANDQDPK